MVRMMALELRNLLPHRSTSGSLVLGVEHKN
jgi:hypothetical protein